MPAQKAKTLDGMRTRVGDINIDLPRSFEERIPKRGFLAKIIKGYKNLSQVMAGMYTGVGCSGTPHTHHSYDAPLETKADGKSKDSSPLPIKRP